MEDRLLHRLPHHLLWMKLQDRSSVVIGEMVRIEKQDLSQLVITMLKFKEESIKFLEVEILHHLLHQVH
ncbi:hypothetical protein EVA_18050 [gut metagenome]|uniref:Uncharacterized protein n=1 Tax=gut metagenome TaxID=749906 RepID=J9FHC0_9ZZZZ